MNIRKIIEILGNKKAGFLLTMVMVLSLISGSLVMNMNVDIYPPFFEFDFKYFFYPVQPVHMWFYFLLIVSLAYSINLVFCVIEQFLLVKKIKNIEAKRWASILAHIAVIFALIAHLIEGSTVKSNYVEISKKPVSINGFGSFYAESIQEKFYPDGKLKDVIVNLKGQKADGTEFDKIMSYNNPVTFTAGIRTILIQQITSAGSSIVLKRNSDGKTLPLDYQGQIKTPEGLLRLAGIEKTKSGFWLVYLKHILKNSEEKSIYLTGSEDIKDACSLTQNKDYFLCRHMNIVIKNETYSFFKVIETPVIYALVKYNPGVHFILPAALLMCVSLILQMLSTQKKKPVL
ncbi:MAG: hypothetical protein OEZ13_01690 [Spirochaetia bacterium]|nr:hypothetical protein [Spirochaetia bacterium]